MEFSGAPVVVFRNPKHEGINVIYRRHDGNISWIDPDGFEQAASHTPGQASLTNGLSDDKAASA